MRFRINKAVFQAALKKCSGTVSRRDAVPVLQNFLLQADEQELRIVGTDLELGLVARILIVDIQDQGKITVPADKLLSIVNEASDSDDITFEVEEGDQVKVISGPTQWNVKAMNADDFPDVPSYEHDKATALDRPALLSAVRRVQRAASDDEQRLSLMMLRFQDGKVYASDGHRLHVADIPNQELDMSLPKLAVNELVALLDRTEAENIHIQITENHLLFRIGNEVFSSGKLHAEFPDVKKLIIDPTENNDQVLRVDRQGLLSALKRVRITSDEKTQAIKVELNGAGTAVLASSDETGNNASEQIEVSWNGPTKTVGFNHKYLEDLLNAHDPEKSVEFKLADDTKHRKAPIRADSVGLTTIVLPLKTEV